MAAASLDERASMQRAEESLERQVLAAEQYAAAIRGSFFVTDAQRAALKAIADERIRFNTWRGAWKAWALVGQEPDGYAYAVAFWLRIGSDIASALKTYSKGLYDASVFTVISNTVKQTAKDVVTPSAWPLWMKVVAGGVVVVVVLVTINNVATIARAVRG